MDQKEEIFFTFLWPPENLGMSRFRTSSFLLLKSILFPKTRRERVKHVFVDDFTKKREREDWCGEGKGGWGGFEPDTQERRTKLGLASEKNNN